MRERFVAVSGKHYHIEVPRGGLFPKIVRLDRIPASGPLAEALEELTGRKQHTYLPLTVERDEEAQVVLALGRNFSPSKAWRREYNWAVERNTARSRC